MSVLNLGKFICLATASMVFTAFSELLGADSCPGGIHLVVEEYFKHQNECTMTLTVPDGLNVTGDQPICIPAGKD